MSKRKKFEPEPFERIGESKVSATIFASMLQSYPWMQLTAQAQRLYLYMKLQQYGQKPLGELVREIVGLDMNAAKEAFSEYLDGAALDSRQIYFVNQIVEYIVHNGMMKDLSVLQESPFTDQGSIVEVFTDLSVWAGIKKIIDKINANAAA